MSEFLGLVPQTSIAKVKVEKHTGWPVTTSVVGPAGLWGWVMVIVLGSQVASGTDSLLEDVNQLRIPSPNIVS